MDNRTLLRFARQLSGPGFRAQQIHASQEDGPHAGRVVVLYACTEGHQYRLEFDSVNTRQSQVNRALMFLCHDPQWRQQLLFPPAPPTWEASTALLAIEHYDEVMAPVLNEMARSGVRVSRYNKGSGHEHGSTLTMAVNGPWPVELAHVLDSLGWLSGANGLKASLPKGYGHKLKELVLLLLDDWLNDSLDHTGNRYRIEVKDVEWMPPMKAYPESALRAQLEKNKRKASRLNQIKGPASFDSYTQLTCGRDSLSGQSLDQLIAQLDGDEVLSLLDDVADNPVILAKALRWRLRGLSALHTLNKYHIDCILGNHAEEKRFEQRKAQFGERAYPLAKRLGNKEGEQ